MNYTVRSLMSTNLISLHPKNKIARAKELFNLYDIHHIPVLVMNKVVGIISQGDILFLSQKPVMHSFDQFIKDQRIELGTVDEIMSTNVITVNVQDPLIDVIDVFINHRINALPVVEHDKIVGLITSYDILKFSNEMLKERQKSLNNQENHIV